jgi:hypothetical protein
VRLIIAAVADLYGKTKGNLHGTSHIDLGDKRYETEHPHLSGKYADVNFIVKSKGNTLLPWYDRLYFKVNHETKNLELIYLGHL